jgi:L-threonylcarbamoyladenylate synthase
MEVSAKMDNTGPVEVLQLISSESGALARAVELLERGKAVAFPTDTVYGIGVHGYLPGAVQDLFAIKGRPRHLAIPLLVPDAASIGTLCKDIPPSAWRLAERFWPGGLSLVLHRAVIVPEALTAGRPTVAVRVPDQSMIRELMRRLNAPLAATSANRHGRPPSTTADQVLDALGSSVSLVLDGGRCPGGMASTVLDMTVSPPTILRHGPITAQALSELVPLQSD